MLTVHLMGHGNNLSFRFLSLFLVTSPWLVRGLFPINSFSDNYVGTIDKETSSFDIIGGMYRMKKYQYLAYKHIFLHGLNISVAVNSVRLTFTSEFRWYWLLLNMSYVMEFFLQTLVKRKKMSQNVMLFMQWLLMMAASLKATSLLHHVNISAAIASLLMNFHARKYDLFNTVVIWSFLQLFQIAFHWFYKY